MHNEIKPCAKCGAEVKVFAAPNGFNALYCDACGTCYVFADEFINLGAVIERYNREHDKLAEGGNDAD